VLQRIGPVEILTTDFGHQTKRRKGPHSAGGLHVTTIPTPSYRSNVSVGRFFSHIVFALRSARYFARRSHKYAVVYVTLPLNLLAFLIFRQARGKTTIADVVDIWPDVLPFPVALRALAAPVFWAWRRLFVSACRSADIVLAVSDSFRREAARHRKHRLPPVERFYIGHPELPGSHDEQLRSGSRIAYVGNFGRLYDFQTLVDAVDTPALKPRIELLLVGEGDRRNWLVDQLQARRIRYQYFGAVYDPVALGSILRRADWGFNGYINTTAAFSYKANTYLAAGLPLLNSMRGDLGELVATRELGLNYEAGDAASLRSALEHASGEQLERFRRNCEDFFASELDAKRVERQLFEYLAPRVSF
jgi:glycosyltransferase involved in cell wall biosynthesis